MTLSLKCEVCKEKTVHARLRDNDDPKFKDVAELRMTGCPGCGTPEDMPCTDLWGYSYADGACHARRMAR